jgi:hypothetical protein
MSPFNVNYAPFEKNTISGSKDVIVPVQKTTSNTGFLPSN